MNASPGERDAGRLAVMSSVPMAAVTGAWVVFATLSALLHVTLGRTGWNMGGAAEPFRTFVLAHTVTREALFALPLGLVAWWAVAAQTRNRGVAALSARALGSGLCVAWFASWALFWNTGQFLDGVSATMGVTNPVQMILHVLQLAPVSLLAVPLLGLVAWELTFRASTSVITCIAARRTAVVTGGVLALAVGMLTAEVGGWIYLSDEEHVTHPEGGVGTTLGGLYRQVRVDRSGPMAHLLSGWGRAAGDHDLRPGPEDLHVEWRPREPYRTEPARSFNVVILLVESLRSDELAAYGSSLDVMPQVDALAAESAVFIDHYAAATHSNYSSVVPISSQFPLWDPLLHVFPEDPTQPPVRLYDVLKPLGYRTAVISSQNELWGGMANFLESPSLDFFLHAETYDGPKYVPSDDVGFLDYVRNFGRAGKIDDRLTMDEVIDWIDDGVEPFVVYVNLQNSHVPYPVPHGAATPFGPRVTSFQIGFNRFPRDSAKVVRGAYRNALRYVDEQVGRLVSHLRERGLLDSTVFVLTGDHGQAFFEHGFAAHANELFEELLRTPLLIRAPDLVPGPRAGLAQHVDIAPTVLALLGLLPHPGFQGVSLLDGPRESAYAVVQTPLAHQYGIVSGGYKLVFDPGQSRSVLRDLVRDPDELEDATPGNEALAAQLRARLDSWRSSQLRYFASPLLQTRFYPPVPTG